MSNPSPPPDDGHAEYRRDGRDSLLLRATLHVVGEHGSVPIRIRNLSSTGLMADSQVSYDEGAFVEVELRGIGIVAGEIVWVRDGRMGITFAETIDPMRARKPVVGKADEHLRKVVDLGKIRRPGLRID